MNRTFYSIDEARLLARKRVPRIMFDYVDGAAGDEQSVALNRSELDKIRLQPRVLVNVESRTAAHRIFDQDYKLPFGIAPMGMCNLTWPKADQLLAEAAVRHGIPLGLSTMASTSLESIASIAAENTWFQLYVSQSLDLAVELVERAKRSGYKTLILTVDVPQVAPRRRELRHGFKTPFKMGIPQFVDFALHPRWSLTSLITGVPELANFNQKSSHGTFDRTASRGAVDLDFVRRLRDLWPGKLIIKGVMSAVDSLMIKNTGADAIYVSNHGGRQLDSAPAAVSMLPIIRQAVGKDYPLIFDSGVRGGEGIIKALASGASFVMLGRPFMYAIGANGARGLDNLINILSSEINVTLAQLGKTSISQLDHNCLL
jgi:isopentenyl diphosphate isomerase/L-lactate dehydrogenase-like FMN-dependent dehydrogenase